MINTSLEWKKALGSSLVRTSPLLVPESFVKIIYRQSDDEAQNDAEASSTSEASYSDTEAITDLSETFTDKYASLEGGGWVLDGNNKLLSANTSVGYVSGSLSLMDGTFQSNPTIEIDFSETVSARIPGLNITFDSLRNQYAEEFSISVINGGLLLNTYIFTGNTSVQLNAPAEMQNFDKLIITISKWSMPLNRAKIESVIIGEEIIIGKKDLLNYTHSMSNDLLAFALPDYSIQFEIDNVDESWNPDNSQGVYGYLDEKQKLIVKYGYNIDGATEWIDAGTYYLSEWRTPQNGISASFTARSLIEFMDTTYTPTAGTYTLKQLAESAFSQAGLPLNDDGTIKYSVDSSLSDYSITITSDFDHTCKEVIQLCANASKCVIKVLPNGDLQIVPIEDEVSDYLINRFSSYTNAEYEISKQLKTVEINDEYSFTLGTSGDVQGIDNELIADGTQAQEVANWIYSILGKRKTLNGEYRCDPRLEVFDVITNSNKYATNTVWITSVKYSYAGAFKGAYEGRVLRTLLNEATEGMYYLGDMYCGGDY